MAGKLENKNVPGIKGEMCGEILGYNEIIDTGIITFAGMPRNGGGKFVTETKIIGNMLELPFKILAMSCQNAVTTMKITLHSRELFDILIQAVPKQERTTETIAAVWKTACEQAVRNNRMMKEF